MKDSEPHFKIHPYSLWFNRLTLCFLQTSRYDDFQSCWFIVMVWGKYWRALVYLWDIMLQKKQTVEWPEESNCGNTNFTLLCHQINLQWVAHIPVSSSINAEGFTFTQSDVAISNKSDFFLHYKINCMLNFKCHCRICHSVTEDNCCTVQPIPDHHHDKVFFIIPWGVSVTVCTVSSAPPFIT